MQLEEKKQNKNVGCVRKFDNRILVGVEFKFLKLI